MTTLLLALLFAQEAVATEPACAERRVATAQHDLDEARAAYRAAHKAYFAVDWKARLAMADDRDAVLKEREASWAEVKALRDAIGDARVAWKGVKQQAHEGTLACAEPASGPEEAASSTDPADPTKAVR